MFCCTGGSAAVIGKHKGATALIKQKSQNCKVLHCILHRLLLVSKKLRAKYFEEASELEKLMSDVLKIATDLCSKAQTNRLFSKFYNEICADKKTLLLHSEVQWLS